MTQTEKLIPAFIGRHKKWLLPVTVIAVAYGMAAVIRNAGPELEVLVPEQQPVVVRVVTAKPEQVRLTIESQGEVDAEHMIDLVSELPGKITTVSSAFVTGGYFEKGDVLLQIDPTNYELGRVRAAAKVAEAVEELEIERTEADLAAKGLFPLREARVASAEARAQSARAELAQAEADLQRTRLRAPFAGRVLFTQVDLGQYVSAGALLGRIFSTGIAEIRLPLTDQQLRFLDLPFGSGSNAQLPDTAVRVHAEVGGRLVEWQGHLHRMEGAVDPDNRVWYAVARVDDPYGLQDPARPTPLVVGLYVEVEIDGRAVDGVVKLPRAALRNKEDVLVVDSGNRLRKRQVDVLRTDFESAYISGGLDAGDRVCVSPIEAFVDGLPVTVVQESAADDQLAVN
jgi:RND family efflux transporter MFP subunit